MKRCYSNRQLPDSALRYVLEGLIPYTDANRKLSFTPGLFFNDLENIAKQKELTGKPKEYRLQTLRNAYYKAKRDQLITFDRYGRPQLTEQANRRLKPYQPTKLGKNAYLIVAFDIPEKRRLDRNHFRSVLQAAGFAQVQKSVWKTEYDHRELIKAEVNYHKLHGFVDVYESVELL